MSWERLDADACARVVVRNKEAPKGVNPSFAGPLTDGRFRTTKTNVLRLLEFYELTLSPTEGGGLIGFSFNYAIVGTRMRVAKVVDIFSILARKHRLKVGANLTTAIREIAREGEAK